MLKHSIASLAFVFALGMGAAVCADKQNGPGVSDTEIKIGQTSAYSGPASAYGTLLSKTQVAYVRMINERGGINGRKITLISLDDGYSPPKTVEQTRRLVEQDQVLGIFDSLGTAPNAAIQDYLNEQKVPHFAISGASRFSDPARYPWTMGVIASYETEGRIYAKYILENVKDAKIGVIYQNDDLGRDYLRGLKNGLGVREASLIVRAASYELTDPTIDSQIISLKAAGANVLFDASSPKFAAQTIRKVLSLAGNRRISFHSRETPFRRRSCRPAWRSQLALFPQARTKILVTQCGRPTRECRTIWRSQKDIFPIETQEISWCRAVTVWRKLCCISLNVAATI